MKNYFLIIVTLIFGLSSKIDESKEGLDIIIKNGDDRWFDEFIKNPSNTYFYEGYIFYPIEIVIKNPSESERIYWEMSCSWQDSWLTNDTNVFLHRNDCDSNIPITKNIKGHDSIIVKTVLVSRSEKNSLLTNKQFRIGFIFISENEYKNLDLNFYDLITKKRKNQKDIIWSEVLSIKDRR